MRPVLFALIASMALVGCASLQKERPPVCDGKHRRPANLYGSVLDPATRPKPPSTPDKLSALPSEGSCRG